MSLVRFRLGARVISVDAAVVPRAGDLVHLTVTPTEDAVDCVVVRCSHEVDEMCGTHAFVAELRVREPCTACDLVVCNDPRHRGYAT